MAGLNLKNINKFYEDGYHAVKNINLEIMDKEFLVLVGPSGCGKSTTLRIIAGIEDLTDGEIYIADTKVNDVQSKDRDIAMVFQNYALYPHMSVYDNMAFGLKLRKETKEEIKNKVKNAAEILEIKQLLDRKPNQLSGGQKQRVALGRAIVRNAKVFLMDEPLSNLDAKLRVTMRNEITKLHKKLNTTFVYVTHDQTEAMTMGTRIAILNNGEIQQIGKPMEIYNNPKNIFVATFIGSPQINLIEAEIVKRDGYHLNTVDFSIKLPDELKVKYDKGHLLKEFTIGIRPEDIYTDKIEGLNLSEAIKLTIDNVENVGSEYYMYLKGEKSYIAKSKGSNYSEHESKINIYLDLDKIHLFDKDTGKIIN